MKTLRTSQKKKTEKKSVKAGTKKAAYEEYLRKHAIAFSILADDDASIVRAVRSNVERILSKRAAAESAGLK